MELKKDKIINSKNISKVVVAYNSKVKRRLFILAIIVLCIIFAIIFLYQPAKDYYFSLRQNDKLQAQYDAIKNTNNKLNQDIEFLKTDDGIKQRATDTLGLIQQGESIGYVSGSELEDTRSNSAASTSSKLAYKNMKTPTT